MASGLLTYNTDLKSLKFGRDQFAGGSSNQPYMTTPIPSNDDERQGNNLGNKDFLLRGGIGAPADSARDVVRLGKYFLDFKGVSGPLFIAKQNILSRIAPATQASGRGDWKKAALNEGIYTPLSTLVQAGINFIGGHVDKQGLNPITGVRTYSDTIDSIIGQSDGEGNRLVNLTNEHEGRNSGANIFSYSGGPNSALGIGRTNIKFATDNRGATLKVLGNEELTESYIKNQTGLGGSDTDREGIIEDKFKAPLGASLKYTQNNNGRVIIEDGTAEAFIIGGDNEGTLASLNAENGITWMNTDGSIPTPKLNNPTELFLYSEPEDLKTATGTYMFASGEYVIDDGITSDDGISWRSNLTNPYATGVKGSLASKKYISRDNKTANPTEDFISPTGSVNYSNLLNTPISSKIGDSNGITWEPTFSHKIYKSGSLEIDPQALAKNRISNPTGDFISPTGSVNYSNLLNTPVTYNIGDSNGVTWEPTFSHKIYKSGSLEVDFQALAKNRISNPTGDFFYRVTKKPLPLFYQLNPSLNVPGRVIDEYVNGPKEWTISNRETPYATGTKGSLATNLYLNNPKRSQSYGDNSQFFKITPDSNFTVATKYNLFTNDPSALNAFETAPVSAINSKSSVIGVPGNYFPSVYNPGTFNPSERIKQGLKKGTKNTFKVLDQAQINTIAKKVQEEEQGYLVDFREPLKDTKIDPKAVIFSIAPNYNSKAVIDNKTGTNNYHYTSPGQRGNIFSYTKGKTINANPIDGTGGELSIVDKINHYPIYKSEDVRSETDTPSSQGVGDLVNFRIATIGDHQGKNPTQKQYLHFRAYIDSFEDNYTGNWDSIKYMGRGESFYKYNGFERGINLSFTVAAQSREELERQYRKLNYLVSNLAPQYSAQGYMGGPLVELTMGNWCYELPGFIGGLSLSVPEESPWEIGIDDAGNRDPENGIMQLPHIVRVTGFNFTPIHTFRPEKENLEFKDDEVDIYGIQKYIAYRKQKIEEKVDVPEVVPEEEEEELVLEELEIPPKNEPTVPPPVRDTTYNVGGDQTQLIRTSTGLDFETEQNILRNIELFKQYDANNISEKELTEELGGAAANSLEKATQAWLRNTQGTE